MIKIRELIPENTISNGNGINTTKQDEVDTCPKKKSKSDVKNGTPKEVDDSKEISIFLESDTEALAHQIAGHSRTGVLKHKLGYVLKPFQKEPLGSREVEFYRKVFSSSDDNDENISKSSIKLLRNLLPKFHGVGKIQTIDEEKKSPIWKQYLALEDIVEGFECPCVTDIKIGAITWDPFAHPAKVEHEKSKYKGTKEPLGLSLTGMQYYDLNLEKTVKMEKELGKTLDKTSFIETLMEFLNRAYGNRVPEIIAKKLVDRLKDFQEYFQVQRDFHFYSSSLLIAYDAKKFKKFINSKSLENIICNEDDEDVSSWLRVLMIDFAHVFPAEGSKPDTNYLFGLNNLVNIFEGIGSQNSTK